MNLGLCILGVALLSAFFLGSLRAVVLIVSVLVVIDVDLVGGIEMWGYDLSSISLVNLVMAVGLVVDYIA